jgi:3-hydroxyisobutyrate dehydrogenase-like beta-hydroxyacid dehydrogenase
MSGEMTFIGFGEAGRAFAVPGARAFDRKLMVADAREAMLVACDEAGVTACDTASKALDGAQVVLSLVTADQAVPAARDYAPLLTPGTLWLDMNSIAPASKQRAAELIGASGGRYVDVAVMAPVLPRRRAVPLLVSGPDAEQAAAALAALGFETVSIAGERIGQASAIKMIRSVMVKGLEALSAECALAAERAGVRDQVIASLDASWTEQGWAERFDYNLERMMQHGERRAAELEEVAVTLSDLGLDPAIISAAATLHRTLGALGLTPPEGLAAKLAALDTPNTARAA